MGCDSAIEYMCSSLWYLSDSPAPCDWSYTHGLNPNNPRFAAEQESRPDWLPENPEMHYYEMGSSYVIPDGVRSTWENE